MTVLEAAPLTHLTHTDTRTVMLVDDHPVYLDGITLILRELMGPVEVIQALSVEQAVALAEERLDLDLVLLDYQLPDANGLALVARLNDLMLTAPMVMMTGIDDLDVVCQALDLGVSGYVHKGGGRQDIRECLAAVEAGRTYVAPDLKLRLDQYRQSQLQDRKRLQDQISERRREVLVCIDAGYSNAEIAATLGISEATVKAHVSALMSIFDADNRSHCAAEARKFGIL